MKNSKVIKVYKKEKESVRMKFKIDKASLAYQLKVAIAGAIEEVTDLKINHEEVHLEHPDNEKYGDYATNVALQATSYKPSSRAQAEGLQAIRKKLPVVSPRQLAERIVERLKQNKSLSDKVECIKVEGAGFINIAIKNEWFVKELQRVINSQEKYGTNDIGKGQTWLVEHTSPNPNKAMHLGHLRNNVTGMAIANIWEALGIKVIRDCIDNNRGIAIAKLMWGYLKFGHKKEKKITDISYWYENQNEWLTPEEAKMRPDKFVDHLYVIASEDFKNKEVGKQVRKLVVDWEKEDKKTWSLWKKVLSYSYAGQQLTLKRLGNKWDKVWHEHEHYKKGKELVKQGLEKGVFRKLLDGAILSDLKSYGLTDTILIKKDGSALYITQDLALTKLKRGTFKADRLFWVIGPEQSLALKQLFAICEQLGIGSLSDFTHIAYGYMSIKGQGKMSSRAGNVIYIDELLDQVEDMAENLSSDETFNINYVDNKIKKLKLKSLNKKTLRYVKSRQEAKDIAKKVAVGAVKYSILKVGRMNNIAFDFKESISLQGNSGPYLQYTYVRCMSEVIKRAAEKYRLLQFILLRREEIPSELKELKLTNLIKPLLNYQPNDEELSILRWFYRFREVVLEAGQEYAPNIIANFLYELAQRYNTFYNRHPILKAELDEQKLFRLALTLVVGQIIKNGLYLLGIETPRKM